MQQQASPDAVAAGSRPNAEQGHAVVIGASMAGLLAARVLSDHLPQVTVVERDRLPPGPAFRPGVPQSRHLHILLQRGRLVLEELFPGLIAELRAAGAQTLDWPGDVLWLSPGGWGQRFRPGLQMLSLSRELLEWSLRRRLETAGRVHFLEQREAVALLADKGRDRVTGVRLRHRQTAESAGEVGETLPADLVVDASGRNSRAPRWLEELGYAPPPQVVVNSFLGYASRTYARPRDLPLDWQALFFQAQPPALARAGALFPIEGGRWIVTLAGAGRDYPPTDDDGFLAFARSLRSPILAWALAHARPLSPVAGYQRTENQLRRYERLTRRPEQFLVVGDAVCAFNPIYGQGMTVAALDALLLADCLRRQRRRHPEGDWTGLAERFQRRLARSNATPWLLATGEDLRYPTTEGARPGLPTRLFHRYLDRLVVASTENPWVNRVFLRVLHMLAPPTALFRPSVLIPSLRTRPDQGLRAPPTAAPLSERQPAS
jgi:2-polyprenyl-6-methoxyphenol hydroxylase-like FAD-dependent oxidoreductase